MGNAAEHLQSCSYCDCACAWWTHICDECVTIQAGRAPEEPYTGSEVVLDFDNDFYKELGKL